MTGRVWLPPQSGAAGQFDESVPAGTQRAFLPSLLGWPLLLAPLNAFERGVIPPVEQTTPARAEFLLPYCVPAGTLDAFCTQFTNMHSISSLHLKREANYAAG